MLDEMRSLRQEVCSLLTEQRGAFASLHEQIALVNLRRSPFDLGRPKSSPIAADTCPGGANIMRVSNMSSYPKPSLNRSNSCLGLKDLDTALRNQLLSSYTSEGNLPKDETEQPAEHLTQTTPVPVVLGSALQCRASGSDLGPAASKTSHFSKVPRSMEEVLEPLSLAEVQEVPTSPAAVVLVSPNSRKRIASNARRASSNWSLAHSGLDDVRRMVQDEIVSRTRTDLDGMSMPSEIKVSRFQQWTATAAVWFDAMSFFALHVGGILPWSSRYFWASLLYQWIVLLSHVAILLTFIARIGVTAEAGHGILVSSMPFMLSDVVIALGAVAGLLAIGILWGSQRLQSCEAILRTCSEEQEFCSVVPAIGFDTLLTIAAWVLLVGSRLGATYVLDQEERFTFDAAEVIHVALFLVSSTELLVLTLMVLRINRFQSGLVDNFCYVFWESLNYRQAVGAWNELQARVRMSSSAIEGCFAALQVTLVLTALALVVDFQSVQGNEWAVASSLILLSGLSQIVLRASAVTEACIRVPQLINSTSLGEDQMDHDRMYLVHYIDSSAAGFYVFNVRLTSGTAIKVFQYTALVAVTIARLIRPS